MLSQTESHRFSAEESYILVDDTLCEHVGSLFEHFDQNLVELYLPLADRFQAYDNSQNENSLIAYFSHKNSPIKVIQQDIWNQILNS